MPLSHDSRHIHGAARNRRPSPALLRLALSLLALLVLAGCGTRIARVVEADPAAPGGWAELRGSSATRVSVTRGGQRRLVGAPYALQKGDIVETGPGVGVLIQFENGGRAILAPRTRVRLGSLEVFFGKVLADLRGRFELFDESLVAALGGTRLLFESRPGRRTEVAVLEGWVQCRSRRGAWAPVRVTAGQRLSADQRGRRPPRVRPMTRAEIRELEQWERAFGRPARRGWCCKGGRVQPGYDRQCPGRFAYGRAQAIRLCEVGWCCSRGRVRKGIRADCRGSFHRNQAAAKRACAAPAPTPTHGVLQGWCCRNGKLQWQSYPACLEQQGEFFKDQAQAKKACKPMIY